MTCSILKDGRPVERLVLENDVDGVDDTRDPTEDGEEDVDEEVGAAATLEEDSVAVCQSCDHET